jgi:hypothetical protein
MSTPSAGAAARQVRAQLRLAISCQCSIFYELLALLKPEDVNPRTSFDWSRVPGQYDPVILEVPPPPSRCHPAAHVHLADPLLSKSKRWSRSTLLPALTSPPCSKLCAPLPPALLPTPATSPRSLQRSRRPARPLRCSSSPVYQPSLHSLRLPSPVACPLAPCRPRPASDWSCSRIMREGWLSQASCRVRPAPPRRRPSRSATRCMQSMARCSYFVACASMLSPCLTPLLQEVARVGFSSAIMMIGGPALTHVTLTFVSQSSGAK